MGLDDELKYLDDRIGLLKEANAQQRSKTIENLIKAYTIDRQLASVSGMLFDAALFGNMVTVMQLFDILPLYSFPGLNLAAMAIGSILGYFNGKLYFLAYYQNKIEKANKEIVSELECKVLKK